MFEEEVEEFVNSEEVIFVEISVRINKNVYWFFEELCRLIEFFCFFFNFWVWSCYLIFLGVNFEEGID